MNILVSAATALEIPGILEEVERRADNAQFPHNTKILVTGVGSVAATFHLTKHLLSNKYDLVIGAGIAGTFNANLLPGEVVTVKKDCFGDLGVVESEQFRTIFDLNLGNPEENPFSAGWIENPQKLADDFYVKSVNGCTVNTISSEPATINRLLNKYNPDIETMEGAAIHYTCRKLNQPFIHLRAISNIVGERDKSKWLIGLAITNLHQTIIKILNAPGPLWLKRNDEFLNQE